MAINGVLSTALSGLNASALKASTAAFNVVNANTPGFRPLGVRTTTQVLATQSTGQGTPAGVTAKIVQETGSVDITRELITQTEAAINYAANATVVKSADELVGTLLDISV